MTASGVWKLSPGLSSQAKSKELRPILNRVEPKESTSAPASKLPLYTRLNPYASPWFSVVSGVTNAVKGLN
ncbi:hypothetical protein D3C87_1726000 [compost metagenome]